MARAKHGVTPAAEKTFKPKRIGSESHHCSQCNRTVPHETWTNSDGILLKCPCGYSFVDVRDINGAN